jgi:carbon storage regulator CsrA
LVEIQCPDGTILEVLVVDIRAEKVRIGFTAPMSYEINRKEIADAIRRENRSASAEAAAARQS